MTSAFDPVTPNTLFKPHLPQTLGLTKVKVTPSLDNPRLFTISWPTQQGAVKYTVYAAPTPTTKNKFTDTSNLTTSVEFEIPIILPDDVVFYIWVAYENPSGKEVFISDEPSYAAINDAFIGTRSDSDDPISFATRRDIIEGDDMKFYIEEIRRRHLAILENDGEDFFLYIRKMYGQPCVGLEKQADGTVVGRYEPQSSPFMTDLGKTFDPEETSEFEADQAKDPDPQSHYRCEDCFGTGWAGGYFPKIRIRVRYGNLPSRIIQMKEVGIEFQHNFNSHTIWHPRLKERDFLVRSRTGERFTIKEPSQSELRGIPMHQEFNAIAEGRNSMIYAVTDDKITAALEAQSGFDVAKFNWAVWM